jgi:hypothetical protein
MPVEAADIMRTLMDGDVHESSGCEETDMEFVE